MDRNLDAPLSPEEFASLKEVSKGMIQRVIPGSHRERLIRLGFIEQVFRSLELTISGQMRAAREE
jgi:hypothetical protein